jgi:hypothetical protein
MNLTNIVDTAVFADFDLLEQLIDFLIGKPLSKVCQNYEVDEYPVSYQKRINKVSRTIAKLSCRDIAISFLVKHLESLDKLLRSTSRLEAIRSRQNGEERTKVDINVYQSAIAGVKSVKITNTHSIH